MGIGEREILVSAERVPGIFLLYISYKNAIRGKFIK